ncbi:MAG TPA: DUF5916 domain-containing protein [Vicinamibacterales bacterium]|nr:DUF5916 domain-containing protein [Vicinamibacterales bacterium]HPW20272.1 DUF5916 domain-containing protein [Vicinamibacterales bacterium]
MGQRLPAVPPLAAMALLFCAADGPARTPAAAEVARVAGGPHAPRVSALRATGPIAVDGRLDEADWQRAPAARDFVQRNPDEGKPATESTDVRFVYDDKALYVGARLFDSEPSKIARRLTRRDGDTDGIADRFLVAFDGMHDRLTGSLFWVTAAGSIGDGVLDNDSSFDETWDGVWDAAVSIDDKGWMVEMRIPFSQLRFSAAERQVWGLHLVRVLQRRNEESWWAPIPKTESGLVSRAGDLDGLDGIQPRRHVELLPYTTARAAFSGAAEPGNSLNHGKNRSAAAGLDLKWGIASNMTVDATVNPDFGQVEVDPAVVNLSVFETYFQEKRPFFIEGSQAFSRFGRNGASSLMGFNRSNPTLFYSRRVGRSPQGSAGADFTDSPSATTILGAAKLTGKTSRGWTVNVIDAVTARESARTATGSVRDRVDVEPLTNYFAARAYRNVGQRAGFGFLGTAVNRSLRTDSLSARLVDSAYVIGADGHWFFSDKRDYVVAGSFSGSRVAGSTPAISRLQRSSSRYYQRPDATHVALDPAATSLSGWSLQSDFNRNSGNLRPNASFWAVSPGFEANDAGYSTTVDRVGMHAALAWQKPTPDRYSRFRRLAVATWKTWNFDRVPMSGGYYASLFGTLRNYWSCHLTAIGGPPAYTDRMTRGGPMMRSTAFVRLSGEIEGDERKPVVWGVEGSYESARDGSWSGEGGASLKVKPLPTLSLEAGPTLARQLNAVQYVRAVADPAAAAMFGTRYVFGALDQTELGMETRINYIMNPRMSLQVYLQPLLSVGRYTGFKEAIRPRTREFLEYGADAGAISYDAASRRYSVAPGGCGAPFSFPDPDFNYKSLRVNAVFRWEFKPGSTLYAVWTQQRENQETDGPFRFGRSLSRLMEAPPDNVFMVKMSYWFGR